ncbi:hypothetical protein CJ195_12050 [Bacillus sp. UMB0899]|nr:hypothetical protein CJ195_12050 [Bacillus sp. UMB0899]
MIITPLSIKLIKETPKAGIKDDKTLETNNSLTVIRANNKLSNVFLSFSPTRLFAAMADAVITGIRRNNDAIM